MDEDGLGEISAWCGARHRPEPPRVLERQTRFTASEIKLMYRGFKQECPSGVVDEDTFKHIFAQFFPLGDASQYAHYVFNTVKHKHSPNINFEEFLLALSRVARGSTQEKLSWVFNLYDTNGDGRISRQELADIVKAVYLLLGRATSPPCRDQDVLAHADRVFTQMDADADGAVSREELSAWILARPHAAAALHTLDTTLEEVQPTCSSNTETNSTDLLPLATKLILSNEISNTPTPKTLSLSKTSTVNSKSKPLTSNIYNSKPSTKTTTMSKFDKISSPTSSFTTNYSATIASLDTADTSKSVISPAESLTPSLSTSIMNPSDVVPISSSVDTTSVTNTSSRVVTSLMTSVPVRVTTVPEEIPIRKARMRRRRPTPPKSRS